MTTFTELGLAQPLLKALDAEGYVTPTPVQAQAIPYIIAGRDLLGIAQTGTGKTAAFALPILHRLLNDPKPVPKKGCRVLVLSPTRELASQIHQSFKTYGRFANLSSTVIFGGVSGMAQARTMARGVDILVATPGRLIDHLGEGAVSLRDVEVAVLDEADQMLDMGFILPIRRLIKAMSPVRQNLFFSATMPDAIGSLAGEILRDPALVRVAPVSTTAERVEQQLIYAEKAQKRDVLVSLLQLPSVERAIVFTRTKHGADRVVRHLDDAGVQSAAIHGNKSQGQRERALGGFRNGQLKVLVATDIAARGIDVDGISHVINFELPNVPETYVHRIGRTARAGASGLAISLCDSEERSYLRGIERLIRKRIFVIDPSTLPRPIMAPRRVEAATAEGPDRSAGRVITRPGGPSRPGRNADANATGAGPRHLHRQHGRGPGQGRPVGDAGGERHLSRSPRRARTDRSA
ncbi:ATP-dependent RNA helicase RhlE [Arboricoccus pini]|uniref:ATP-dependent RNA helicase RhlE n=1 Tax=Arboricoccus pini TaxID=1963835 RepID=A0A212R2I2_9PROT|nr:DEAD/DEAH box helicase [Arboricoccus pini]SNB66200.1 ATP-dependent RNA helicase RhlE [Arboricoccus pini]